MIHLLFRFRSGTVIGPELIAMVESRFTFVNIELI